MIIDSHTKIYPPHFNNIRGKLLKTDPTFSSLFSNPNARLVTGSDLLTSMNRNQIDMSIIAGIGWTKLEVAKEANNYLLAEARQNPTRFLALCSVDPSWGIESINELERCARLGAKGIGEPCVGAGSAALTSAIADALEGKCLCRTPLTADVLLAEIEGREPAYGPLDLHV